MFGSHQKTPGSHEGPESFAPKVPVLLDAPKDDPITYEELSKCDGTRREECLSARSEPLIFDLQEERTLPSLYLSQSRAPSSMFHEIGHINQKDLIAVRRPSLLSIASELRTFK